jgi:hypothetical protein
MGDSDRQASANLGISIDNPAQMRTYGPQIMNLIGQSKQIVGRGLNRDELEERLVKLETLAKKHCT